MGTMPPSCARASKCCMRMTSRHVPDGGRRVAASDKKRSQAVREGDNQGVIEGASTTKHTTSRWRDRPQGKERGGRPGGERATATRHAGGAGPWADKHAEQAADASQTWPRYLVSLNYFTGCTTQNIIRLTYAALRRVVRVTSGALNLKSLESVLCINTGTRQKHRNMPETQAPLPGKILEGCSFRPRLPSSPHDCASPLHRPFPLRGPLNSFLIL